MPDKKTKRDQANKINEIQGNVQNIFFDLEEFADNDTANAAQKKCIELMDSIAEIRKRILQNGNASQ